MALSNSVLEKIRKDTENKRASVKNSDSYEKTTTTTGSQSHSRTDLKQKIAMDTALKRAGFTHKKDTGLLNDSRYKNYYDTEVNEDYVNRFFADWNNYEGQARTAYDNLGWKAATSGTMDNLIDNIGKDLSFRAAMARSYFDVNRDSFDEETYKSFMDRFDSIDQFQREIGDGYADAKKYYSQWETEEDFGRYVAQKKDYEAKLNLDLAVSEQEINNLEAVLEEYKGLTRWMTDKDGEARAEWIRQNYGGEKEIEALINEKKTYLNQAKHVQNKAGLAAVGDQESENYDPEYGTLSQYLSTTDSDEFGDPVYEWINNRDGYRDKYDAAMAAMNAPSGTMYLSEYAQKGYDKMTESEVATYNYWYAKEGKEKAQEYLNSIQEDLNYRLAGEAYGQMEDKTALEMVFGINAGLNQFESGIKNAVNTKSDYIPATAEQITSGMVREDLADNGPQLPQWMGGASLGQVGYDAITTTANMAPSILASTFANYVVPGSGAAVGNVLMGTSAMGNAYQEAINAGHDKNQARNYATAIGISEVALQYALGGIGKLGGKVSGNVVSKALQGVDNAIFRVTRKILGNMASEGLEEGLQEILTPIFSNILMGTKEDVDWGQVAYSAILGVLTAGVMEGPGTISEAAGTYQTGRQLKNADVTAVQLAEIGKGLPAESVASQLAGRVDENTGAYTMGRLFEEIGATLTEQNIADIASSLEQSGMSKENAAANAEIFARVADGSIQLTEEQRSVIEANDVLAQTVRDVVLDENSTVNTRSKGYREIRSRLDNAQEISAVDKTGENGAVVDKGNLTTAEDSAAVGEKSLATGKENLQVGEAEEGYTASADGKTVLSTTGEKVKISKIASMDSAGMKLELEDGSVVDAKDIGYASDGEAMLYESIAELGASAKISNLLVDAYLKEPGDVTIEDYTAGMLEAFNYGRYHIPAAQISGNEAVGRLTEVQRNTAYELGKAFGKELVNTREANVKRAKAVAKAQRKAQEARTVSKKETVAQKAKESGKVHFDRKGRTFSEAQETGLKTMEQLSQLLGVEFYVFESYEKNGRRVYMAENGQEMSAPNGYYDPETGHIYIDLNAGSLGRGTILFTVSHELTHFIREWSPQKYDALAEVLFEQVYQEQNISVIELIRNQQEKAARNGRELSFDEAYEEVVADSMESILTSGRVVELMAEVKQQDQTLWRKIRKWFRNLAEDIRKLVKAYEGYKPDSAEGRAVAAMEEMLPVIEGFYTDALQEASANYQAAGGQKNTAQKGGDVRYCVRDGSLTTETTEEERYELLKDAVVTLAEVDKKAIQDVDLEAYNTRKKSAVVPGFKALANQLKILNVDLENSKISFPFQFSGRNLEKSLHHQLEYGGTYQDYVKAMSCFTDIVKNAVPIEVHPEKKTGTARENPDLLRTYVLVSAYKDGKSVVPVQLEVKEFRQRGKSLYMTVMLTKIDLEVVDTGVPGETGNVPHLFSRSTISLRQLFENVNVKDGRFLKYIPDGFLSAEQKEAKQAALKKQNEEYAGYGAKKHSMRDSSGTELTDAQAEYFRDSKVRDTDGNLLVMYHGTSAGGHTIFDPYGKSRYGLFGAGSYFTESRSVAEGYTKKGKGKNPQIYEAYLNIKNPMDMDADADPTAWEKMFPDATFPASGTNELFYRAMEEYFDDEQYTRWEAAEIAMGAIEDMGYDGITHIGGGRFNKTDDIRHRVYIAFQAEQIKNTDNLNPTDNPDIRYSERDPLQEKTLATLEEENVQLREDVSRLKDLVKLQKKLTHGTMFTQSSVEFAARVLKKRADATGNTKELAGLLEDFYGYIAKGEELTWESVKEAAQPAVDWLRENRRKAVDEYSAEVLKELRTRKISLSETQKNEAAYTHESYNNYRKALFGSVNLAKDGMPLDSAWAELADMYPSVFDANISSSDMPGALVDIIARLRNSMTGDQLFSEAILRQELTRDVYDSYWNVSTLRTVADVKQKEINALKSKHAQRIAELREAQKAKTAELRQEQKAAVEAVKQKERERAEAKTRKILDQQRENRKQAEENRAVNRKKTDARRKIRKSIMELRGLLNNGNKKRHVKDGMRDLVKSSLDAAEILFIDEYSNRDMVLNGVGTEFSNEAEEKAFREAQKLLDQIRNMDFADTMEFDSEIAAREYMTKLDGQLSAKMAKLKDLFARERRRLYGTKVSELLGNLAAEYKKLNNAEDGAVRAAMDENVYAHLLQLQEDIEGVTVKDMNLAQLEKVADAYTMVLTTVRNANRMFAKNLNFRRDVLAGMAMEEVRKAGGNRGTLFKKVQDAVDSFSWNNLKPVYAFERLGSDTLKTLYGNIRKGQDVWAVDMQEADAFRREQYRKYNRKGWDFEKLHRFTSTAGVEFQLNLEQIMSLYAYSRREAAMDHLLKGGFVFGGSTEVVVKKNGIKQRYLHKDATAYNLTMEELRTIVNTLTAEQKAFVEEMQTYLSDTMGGKGNEISLKLYGIKSFDEKHYFPLRSAGQYMERAKEADFRKQQGQTSIVNSGFTKATTPHANNPIVLDGFMDVWAEHVNDMSMYHGFALPMEDFRRVYNYSTPNVEAGQSNSVNAVIENAFGKAATQYIDQLYKDLNGGAVSDNRESLSKKLVGLHKKAAVLASASVVIQQPTAVVRAFALIDPKYFIGAKVDQKRHKALWGEVKQHAPVAFIKEMGYFDTGMGRSAKDFLQAEEYHGLSKKVKALTADSDYRDEVLGKAPALADELTWCAIWEAVKRETKAKNPGMDTKSDAFLQKAGERFSEVIDMTQVYDSVLSRSANMRSKTLHMNMLTSFMAEPTTSINMLEDALRKVKKGNKKQFARTVGAVYGSVLLNAMLASLVYAARDDDEDETFAEKYWSSVAVETLDGINPITYYPFLRDIWSIFQGYDVERADMSLISDLADTAKKALQVFGTDTSDMDEEELEEHQRDVSDALWSLVDSIASLTGIPVKNMRRDILGAYNAFKTISADVSGRETTKLSLLDSVEGAVMDSIPIAGLFYDKSKGDKLYEAIVQGDAAYAKRIRESYDSDDSYHTVVRRALRENDSRIWQAAIAWNSDNMDSYLRIAKQIVGEGHFSQDDVVLAIRAEASAMEEKQGSETTSKTKGYFTGEKFGVAIAQGNDSMADIVRDDIISTARKNGKTEEEAERSFQSTARSQVKELFTAGDISENRAADLVIKYGGYEQEDAADKVAEWKYEMDHPELQGRITYTQYKRWETDGKDQGVSLEVFTDVAEFRDNGTSGNTRSQEEVAAYIDKLTDDVDVKDALWCCFWKESTLKNAPWH